MAAVVRLTPLTDHGRELLDELESQTQTQPVETLEDGTREYYLSAKQAEVDAFDRVLDRIDENWREHLARSQMPRFSLHISGKPYQPAVEALKRGPISMQEMTTSIEGGKETASLTVQLEAASADAAETQVRELLPADGEYRITATPA
jgi:preprotein translocase subunit SecA